MPADCLFCKIINGEIESKREYQDDDLIIINDINPKADIHLLVIPKKHISTITELKSTDRELVGKLIDKGQQVAQEKGLKGFKMLFNVNKEGGQEVFHIHLHVMGNLDKDINLAL
jgi:histidine triad (HIT) family protein